MFIELNNVDEFLEEKILSFLAYSYVTIQSFDKAIELYNYKHKKMLLTAIEKYNLNMSLTIFCFRQKKLKEVQSALENVSNILPGRIDTEIYQILL